MAQETFIIGNREFTSQRMNAFAANKLLLRLQKVVLPVLGTFSGVKNMLDVDLAVAAKVISENLDESMMDNIVLPMFAESRTYCVEKKKFLVSGTDIDVCFTTEQLFDLYELIFAVGRFQFAPFFLALMERYGDRLAVANPNAVPQDSSQTS